jgi:hypothetical protein
MLLALIYLLTLLLTLYIYIMSLSLTTLCMISALADLTSRAAKEGKHNAH